MRLQMRRIDHQPGRLAGLARKLAEDFVEHAETAPAHEPFVDRLVRTVAGRRIAPAQSNPDDEDDPANHTAVIHPHNSMRAENTARSGASARPTTQTDHPWQGLPHHQ